VLLQALLLGITLILSGLCVAIIAPLPSQGHVLLLLLLLLRVIPCERSVSSCLRLRCGPRASAGTLQCRAFQLLLLLLWFCR
jgi:hypothetical protein